MSKLTTKRRNALPSKDFALPKERGYPISDKSHARNALSRVSQHGSSAEKAEVRAKVHAKYPGIGKKKEEGRKIHPHGRELERRLAARDKRY